MSGDVTRSQYSARRGWTRLALAIVAGLALTMSMMVLTMVAMARLPGDELLKTGVAELGAGLLAAVAVFVLGGRKWLAIDGDCILYAFGMSWMLLIVGAVAPGYSVFLTLASGPISLLAPWAASLAPSF